MSTVQEEHQEQQDAAITEAAVTGAANVVDEIANVVVIQPKIEDSHQEQQQQHHHHENEEMKNNSNNDSENHDHHLNVDVDAQAVVVDVEAQAAAEAAAAAAATFTATTATTNVDGEQYATDNANSKWSRNGYGAPIIKQTGKFSKEESEIVRNSIEEYCNAKQITVSRLCSECDHKAELKGAWMEIAKRLPHRSVQSVYRHGIRQCHPFKRGAWTELECETLQDLVSRLGKKWSSIQSKLNRSADSCRDKYREMSDEYIKGRWKDDECEQLKKLIYDHLNSITKGATAAITDMRELGKLVDEENIQIPWSTISKKMQKRSRLSCFKKWQKMTGLFHTPTPNNDDDNNNSTTTEKHHILDNKLLKDNIQHQPDTKRMKTDHNNTTTTTTSINDLIGNIDEDKHQHNNDDDDDENDETNSNTEAELAAETVEALELPDTDTLHPTTTHSV